MTLADPLEARDSREVRYRVLGPIEVLDGSRGLPLGGARQRLVLALLLSRSGAVCRTDWLVDAVWGAHPPRTARKTLQAYVARLRSLLGDGAIRRVETGYVMDVQPGEVDADEFADRAARGHRLLASDPASAMADLDAALALWRGPPFGQASDAPALAAEGQRLRELRLTVIEDRVDAEQQLGHRPSLVGELEALVSDHPERGRLRAALMLALYRSGREAEALALYDEVRTGMGEQLGADPDPALRTLHERILRQDPALAAPTSTPTPGGGAARNPYKGLSSFTETDSHDFFGRDGLVRRLCESLEERTFVVVTGASGCGKSSVVRAGLLPRLDEESWSVVTINPGAHPFESLLDAAGHRLSSQAGWQTDDLDVLRTLQLLDGQRRALLVVDQFEELFTLSRPATRERFLANLVAVADDPAGRCAVVATLRADFLDEVLDDPTIGAHVADALVPVAPLSAGEVVEAAGGPAAAVGCALEPELGAELVADMAAAPRSLPLFEYALTELFDHHQGGVLTLRRYRSLGGLKGALARRAEQTFRALEPSEQEAAKRAFLRLVTVSESGAVTRRRVARADVETLDEGGDAAVEAFGRARLLTFDRDPVDHHPTVELAHEALVSAWPRLSGWVEESLDDLRMGRMLAQEVAEWESAGRDAGYLIRESRLAAYDTWPHTSAVAPTAAESEFLARSRRERTEQQQARRRSTRRLRALVVATTIAAVLATSLAAVSVHQAGLARSAADAAHASRLAEASAEVVERDNDLALLLAMESLRVGGRTAAAMSALHEAVSQDRLLLTVHGAVGIDLLPEGRMLVGGERPRVVDTATGGVVGTIPSAGPAESIAASPDGRLAATWGASSLEVWDLSDPADIVAAAPAKAPVLGAAELAFDAEGGHVAALTRPQDGGLAVYDSSTGDLVARRVFVQDPDAHIAFAGELLLHASETRLSALDTRSSEWVEHLTTESRMTGVTVLTGSRSLTTHMDGSLHLWDSAGRPLSWTNQGSPATAVAVDPVSQVVATADADGVVRLWQTGQRGLTVTQSFRTGRGPLVDLALRGSTVAGVDTGGVAAVWRTGPPAELERWAGGGPVAVSPSGTTVVVASDEAGSPVLAIHHLDDGSESTLPAPLGAAAITGLTFVAQNSAVVVTYEFPSSPTTAAPTEVDIVDVDECVVLGSDLSSRPLSGDVAVSYPLVAVPFCEYGASAWVYRIDDLGSGPTDVVQAASDDDPGACGRAVDITSDATRFSVAAQYPRQGTAIYDTKSGTEVTRLDHPPADHAAARFSPDDRRIVTTGVDETARIWDAEDGTLLAVLDARAGPVLDARWLPDGTGVVTSHADGAARVWDAASGRLLTAVGHHSTWPYIDVSPDGRRLVTSADGVARMWTLDPDELIELAESGVSRSFTQVECDRYGVETCQSD